MEATSTLRATFHELLTSLRCTHARANDLWAELTTQHSAKSRYYHNIHHLDSLLHHLLAVKTDVEDWNAILFSMFYYDYVYDVSRSDNEERSAEHAANLMSALDVPLDTITRCTQQILLTKRHEPSADLDTNLFTDADLAILGASWQDYSRYASEIRNEYAMYADLTFCNGRKAVLQRYLGMDSIYKTDRFRHKFESQARENIGNELHNLDHHLSMLRAE